MNTSVYRLTCVTLEKWDGVHDAGEDHCFQAAFRHIAQTDGMLLCIDQHLKWQFNSYTGQRSVSSKFSPVRFQSWLYFKCWDRYHSPVLSDQNYFEYLCFLELGHHVTQINWTKGTCNWSLVVSRILFFFCPSVCVLVEAIRTSYTCRVITGPFSFLVQCHL